MATEEKKKTTYPYIPTRNWWDLRRQFRRSRPSQVTVGYLQTSLGVGESRAQTLAGHLRAIGLITAEGSPTDLADDWRDDERYAGTCQAMFESLYPAELRDSQPPPQPNRGATVSWFMRNAGVGEVSAGQMAQFYALLAAADVTDQETKPSKPRDGSSKDTASRRDGKRGTGSSSKRGSASEKPSVEESSNAQNGSFIPSISVAVQVYIPSEATPEQIDTIFASMAKHFGART